MTNTSLRAVWIRVDCPTVPLDQNDSAPANHPVQLVYGSTRVVVRDAWRSGLSNPGAWRRLSERDCSRGMAPHVAGDRASASARGSFHQRTKTARLNSLITILRSAPMVLLLSCLAMASAAAWPCPSSTRTSEGCAPSPVRVSSRPPSRMSGTKARSCPPQDGDTA
jgi:hypothetical protein